MSSLSEMLAEGLRRQQAGQPALAERAYQEILVRDPGHADANHLLGALRYEQGRWPEALELITRAIRVNDRFAAYHNNLGLVHRSMKRLPEALASFDAALRLDPGYANAHNNRGSVLADLCRFPEALESYRSALQLNPGLLYVYSNLGQLLHELGQLAEAREMYEHVLRVSPSVEVHARWMEVLRDQGQPTPPCAPPTAPAGSDGARIRSILTVPEIMPTLPELREERRRLEDAVARLLEERLVINDPLREVGTTNFYSAYHDLNDRDLQRNLATLFSRATPGLLETTPLRRRPVAGRRLRIGFISTFFHMHTMGKLNTGIVAACSRALFEVLLLRFPGPIDPLAEFMNRSADGVVMLPEDLAGARRAVAALELDVLFYTDIGMSPLTYFLAFARLAPVQCVTWGHPVTTGLTNMDYFISSVDLEPPGSDDQYTERLIRLQHLAPVFYPPQFVPPLKTRAEFGLSERHHIYLCPQAPFKIHPEFDLILGEVLRRDPQGRLVFIRSSGAQALQLMRRFRQTVPDVVDRIVWVPHQSGQHFLHLSEQADVLLDPIHFGGGNTNYEVFTRGATIVTLKGDQLRNRITYAQYRAMGVMDCVARTPEEYVEIALRLGTDRAHRDRVRAKILEAKGVLYENPAGLRELEQFLVRAVGDAAQSC